MALRSEFGGLDRKRRGRFYSRLFKFTLLAGTVLVFSYWAYVLGQERSGNANRDLTERLNLIADENERLRQETEAAVAARVTADERAAAFQRRYVAEVPQGPARDIMMAVNKRLADGIAPERMATVVGAVQNKTRCESEIASRRFILQTPLTAGTNSSVSFSDNRIVVGGGGESARDAAGNVEAWFDTALPVTMTFTLIGGRVIKAAGLLPLYHSVVIDDVDHRFTVTSAKTRGFVAVTEQRCAYP